MRSKFYFNNNPAFAIKNTSIYTNKIVYIEGFMSAEHIKKHKQVLKLLRDSADKIPLKEISNLYISIKNPSQIKAINFAFNKIIIRNNINSIKFSWDADIKILLYYFRYKLKSFFKK